MRDMLFSLMEVTLTMSAVIAVLLALGKVLERRFAPQWRYWAWLVVALRLMVPFNLSLPQAPVQVTLPQVQAAARSVEAAPSQGALPQAPSLPEPEVQGPAGPEETPAVNGWAVLFGLWCAGGALFLLIHGISYVNYRRKIMRWTSSKGSYEGIPIIESAVVMSPMLMGLLRPMIVVPEGGAQEFALLHEACHARRHDLWYKLLLLLANALHWFNPLVWLLRHTAEQDLEIACDAAVLEGRDRAYRQAYGQTLLETVAARRAAGAVLTSAFSGNKKSLKQRFASLMDMAPRHPGRAALALVCAIALLGGSIVACRSGEAPQGPELEDGDLYDAGTGLYFNPALGCGFRIPEEIADKLTIRTVEYSEPGLGSVYLLDRALLDAAAPVEDQELSHYAVYEAMRTKIETEEGEARTGWMTGSAGAIVDNDEFLSEHGQLLEEFHRLLGYAGEIDGSFFRADSVQFLSELEADPATGEVTYSNSYYGFRLALPESEAKDLVAVSCEVPEYTWDESIPQAPQPWPVMVGAVLLAERALLAKEYVTDLIREEGGSGLVVCVPRTAEEETGGALSNWKYQIEARGALAEAKLVPFDWPDGTVYAWGGRYTEPEGALTFRPVQADEAAQKRVGEPGEEVTLAVAPDVRLGKTGAISPESGRGGIGQFLQWQMLSSVAYETLKLTVENEVITEMEWVALPPAELGEAAAPAAGVIHEVDAGARTISGYWLQEDGSIDFDAPFTLDTEQGSFNIQLLDAQGRYGEPITLEELRDKILPLSSWGIACDISVMEGVVAGIVERPEPPFGISDEMLRGGSGAGFEFRHYRSERLENGSLSVTWALMNGGGPYQRLWLTAEEETEATVTYHVTEPGDGFVLALVYSDGTVQRLAEGENAASLSAGRTLLSLYGTDGTAGGFTLEAAPNDKVTIGGA